MRNQWVAGLQDRVSARLFDLARRRDETARRANLQRRMASLAATWTERTGIGLEQMAVGVNPDGPLEQVLLGLRLGTCQLALPCRVVDVDASITVTYDALRGRDLRVVMRPRVPLQNQRWPQSAGLMPEVRHVEADTNPPVLIDGVFFNHRTDDDDIDSYLTGTAELVEIGDASVSSTHWVAHLIGPFALSDHWNGSVSDVEVSLAAYPVPDRYSGISAWARRPTLGSFRAPAEWATWRRADLQPDVARLLRVELAFSKPTSGRDAELFLLDPVCRLLQLYSGARPTLCGLWHPQQRVGRLLDLGRSLVSRPRRSVHMMVVLSRFLDEVAPAWDALPGPEQHALKVAMDSLAAIRGDLEPGIAGGAMTLEFLADSFLPPTKNSYNLTKPQKDAIRLGLATVAAQEAPGTTWESDLPKIDSRLFFPPAGDRLAQLLQTFGVPATAAELRAYTSVRNDIIHGRPGGLHLKDKTAALQFELFACSFVVLRKAGYTGQVRDSRSGKLLGPRQGSHVV
ncbi:hypothetical protein [Nocardioides renjunii]|uniref:hypothetical protein n=1 Tax=Nocardioides renjunii TaxID=3095075 RepID=UPI002AFDD473|nr:hypothetical protein [Nocardioides sp. S-34]WQQ22402.1 hypothetical protein SHK17_00115 [Nocardioides sp. S-34]